MPSPFHFFTAEELNLHYASMVASHDPLDEEAFQKVCDLPLEPTARPFFTLDPIQPKLISELITALPSKGTGVDGLSARMLKTALIPSLPSITNLLNASILTASFASQWKKAIIIPILKVKSPATPSDTRPIAQLPELSKVLERVVHRQLTTYLDTHNLLDPRQAGFRPGHSTQTALLGVLDDIRLAIDKRMLTILILFDFSKAFDRIPHRLLIAKLRALKIGNHALRWFYSYLADRLQAVVDDGGRISDWLEAQAGVPQGSVLGPLLFAIYINDLPKVLRWSKYMIYADDTQVYHSFLPSDLHRGFAAVSRDAQAVADWARQNGLTLNLDKTKALLLGSQRFVTMPEHQPHQLPPILVDGRIIPLVSEAKNLGVWITPTINWNLHIRHLARKVYATLSTLRFYRRALSRDLKIMLVESLALPHFDYASVVYHDLDKERTKQLLVLLNACVRYVVGYLPQGDHVTPHRLALGWLTPENRREVSAGVLAYRVLATNSPSYLAERFVRLNSDLRARRTPRLPAQALSFATPRTEAWLRSFTIRSTRIINATAVTEFSMDGMDWFRGALNEQMHTLEAAAWRDRDTTRYQPDPLPITRCEPPFKPLIWLRPKL